MYKRNFTLFLILCIFMSAMPGRAEESTPKPNLANNIQKTLTSRTAGQIFKRLGEPGFYISKFLNYRKQVNQPICATSERFNQLSILTSLVGDVTAHAFDYFELKKVKKKYADRLSSIKKYQDTLKKEKRKLLDYDVKAPDVQLDALQHQKEMVEVELKRAEIARAFNYTSLGLFITSKILAQMESAAEASSVGTALAKVQACKAAKYPNQQKDEARIQSILDGKAVSSKVSKTEEFSNRENTPWYLVPFQYLAKGVDRLEKTKLVKSLNSYNQKADKEKIVTNLKADNPEMKSTDSKQALEIADSAAYAEDMIVNVVTSVLDKWKDGKNKQSIEDDINGIKKKKDSGIMKLLNGINADEIAIRYAVRTLIKTKLIEINTFMRSGVGRVLVFTYNIYLIHKTIKENEAQVEYAKKKISLLDKTIKSFNENKATTWMPTLQNVINLILPNIAHASVIPSPLIFPLPPCSREILPDCKADSIDLISSDIRPYFDSLPSEVQIAQQNILRKNYSLSSALKLASGKTAYEEIDINKTMLEIASLENYSSQLDKRLPKGKLPINYEEQIVKKFENENVLPAEILASYNSNRPDIQNLTDQIEELEQDELVVAETETDDLPLESQVSLATEKLASKDNSMPTSYVFKTINKKDSDIFQVITNRYMQIYSRKELIEY